MFLNILSNKDKNCFHLENYEISFYLSYLIVFKFINYIISYKIII